MSNDFALLPFFFRETEKGIGALLTNQLGAFCQLDSRDQLEALVESDFSRLPPQLIDDLLAKSFICERKETDIRVDLIALTWTPWVVAPDGIAERAF